MFSVTKRHIKSILLGIPLAIALSFVMFFSNTCEAGWYGSDIDYNLKNSVADKFNATVDDAPAAYSAGNKHGYFAVINGRKVLAQIRTNDNDFVTDVRVYTGTEESVINDSMTFAKMIMCAAGATMEEAEALVVNKNIGQKAFGTNSQYYVKCYYNNQWIAALNHTFVYTCNSCNDASPFYMTLSPADSND